MNLISEKHDGENLSLDTQNNGQPTIETNDKYSILADKIISSISKLQGEYPINNTFDLYDTEEGPLLIQELLRGIDNIEEATKRIDLLEQELNNKGFLITRCSINYYLDNIENTANLYFKLTSKSNDIKINEIDNIASKMITVLILSNLTAQQDIKTESNILKRKDGIELINTLLKGVGDDEHEKIERLDLLSVALEKKGYSLKRASSNYYSDNNKEKGGLYFTITPKT